MENKTPLNQFLDRPILRQLKRLTTPNGLIQHADLEVPDPAHGYSIDDNARGLIACLWHYQLYQDQSILHLAEIYLNYLEKVQKTDGTFHNFVSFSDKKLDEEGSEDSIGRAIWALGEVIKISPNEEMVARATKMLDQAIFDKHLDHEHIRTKAYILLGLIEAGRNQAAIKWADKLVEIYKNNNSEDWHWFENGLFYANGILPYALARAGIVLNIVEYIKVAEETYIWLDKISRDNNIPSPIGQEGWYIKGKDKTRFDQQPLEAADMVLAATELYLATTNENYLTSALEWYNWYEGNNIQQKSLINTSTGGIYDGLTPHGVNENQGAESIVTFLLAYLQLARVAKNND